MCDANYVIGGDLASFRYSKSSLDVNSCRNSLMFISSFQVFNYAVPRSTQPSTLRGTVNEYQPYG